VVTVKLLFRSLNFRIKSYKLETSFINKVTVFSTCNDFLLRLILLVYFFKT